mmetsp:Transcript_27337/g.50117  ORF Transcript_27337/g.50117 Transcript_27337/m.50117 type:complete len:580 (-) Transcript_27337:214-1953(-)
MARLAAPMVYLVHPTFALRHIGPCADKCQAFADGINIPIGAVNALDLAGHPVVGDRPAFMQIAEDRVQEVRVLLMADAPEVGHAAHVPKQAHGRPISAAGCDFGGFCQRFERHDVVSLAGAHQHIVIGRGLKATDKCVDTAKLQRVVAPLQLLQRGKTVIHDRPRHAVFQRTHIAGDTKGAILLAATRTASNLGQLVWGKGPHPPPIEFRKRGKGHMVDIKVQPHADGIGGDQKIHLAVLIHVDLGVAGTGGKRAHDHGGTALLAADQFGNGIDVVDRKADDGRAWAHPADLFLAGIDKLRHPFALHVLGFGHQSADWPTHRVGAQKQGFVQATRPQQTVGEHMAPLGVGAQLNLVNGQKINAHALWHRLDGTDPILGPGRHDPFLARDQRHNRRSAQRHDPVIDLAREQAQGQADHASAVAQHPVDGIGGFTCIGRAENGHNPCVARHGLSPNCSELAPDASAFELLLGLGGVFVMGMQVEDLGKSLLGPAQIAEFLQHDTQAEKGVVVVRVQDQRLLQIVQRRTIKTLHVIGRRAGMPAFGKVRRVIGHGRQMLNGDVQFLSFQRLAPPAQQHIQRR